MKLLKVEIDDYKQLKNFEVSFETAVSNLTNLNLNFLIGGNGSGKSSFLEALSIIFTYTPFDIAPGFDFLVEYVIEGNDENSNVIVKIQNVNRENTINSYKETKDMYNNNFEVFTKHSGEGYIQVLDPFSERDDLHPSMLFTISSGPQSKFEDIVVNAPNQMIMEKIKNYHEQYGNYLWTDFRDFKKISDGFLYNPKALNFDSESLIFILISLLFYNPVWLESQSDGMTELSEDKQEKMKNIISNHEIKVNELWNEVSESKAIGFSIKVNETKYEISKEKFEKYDSFSTIPKDFFEKMDDFLSTSTVIKKIEIEKDKCTYGHYYYSKDDIHQNDFIDNKRISSLEALITMMIAYRVDIISDATIYLSDKSSGAIFDQSVFSDGQWLWICKMGLAILSQVEEQTDFLIFYDEPDAYLNEMWVESFVSKLNEYSTFSNAEGTKQKTNHQYFIATHSTLLLTDAFQNQVYQFRKNNYALESDKEPNIELKKIESSLFGADRTYVSSKLFLEDRRVGRYSGNLINQAIKDSDLEKIEGLLEEIGQGYDRFRLEEKRISLTEE